MLYENEKLYTPLMPFLIYVVVTYGLVICSWTLDHSDQQSMRKTCQKMYSFILKKTNYIYLEFCM